jgi:hypothetical protein
VVNATSIVELTGTLDAPWAGVVYGTEGGLVQPTSASSKPSTVNIDCVIRAIFIDRPPSSFSEISFR